jgi:hypothetical protein
MVCMKTAADEPQRWSTSSFGHSPDTSPQELSALGQHLCRCQASRGRLFALRCAADALSSFVAARFVTALVVGALLIALIVAALVLL